MNHSVAQTIDFFQENLKIFREYYPETAESLASHQDRFAVTADLLETGDYALFIQQDGQRCLFHGAESFYYKEGLTLEMNDYLWTIKKQGNTGFIIYGLDTGFRLAYLFDHTVVRCPLFVVERYPEVLRASMRCFDFRGLIRSQRVFFFVGEDAPQQAVAFMRKNLNMFLPFIGAMFCRQIDQEFYMSACRYVSEQIKGFFHETFSDESRRQVETYYNSMTKKDLVELFSPAGREKVRVLGELNTETKIMQHVMNDCLDAFAHNGYATEVQVTGGVRAVTHLYQGDIFKRFKPNLWFKINHTVKEQFSFTDNIITVSWILDFLPVLLNKDVPISDKIAAYDQVMVMSRDFLRDELIAAGFPRERLHLLYFGGNTKEYRPLRLSPEEQTRYGRDISFTGNYYDLREATVLMGKRMASELYHWMVEAEEFYPTVVRQKLRELENEIGPISFSDSVRDTFQNHYGRHYNREHILMIHGWLGVSGAALRLSYLQEIADMDLAIWGQGWDHDLRLRHAWRGNASHGEELAKIYTSSKINLHIGCFTNNHPRVFDIIASGGFLLARFTPEDEGPGGIGDLFEIGKEIDVFRTRKEMRQKIEYYLAHDEERQEIARRGYERLLKEHTLSHRMAQVMDIVYEGLLNE